ncbi:MAG: biotin/lipoyl-containing protein [Oscillospiraceae bacterium]
MKYVVSLNNKNYEVEVTESNAILTSVTDAPISAPVAVSTAPPASSTPAAAPAAPATVSGGTNVVSPMPGNIMSVSVSVGQSVKSGELLVVLEAMKMENEIFAPADGVVKQVLVSKGSVVNTDDVLVVL